MRAPTIRLRSLLRSRKFRPRRLLFKLNWKKRRARGAWCALHGVGAGPCGVLGRCTGRTSRFKRVGSQRVPAVFLEPRLGLHVLPGENLSPPSVFRYKSVISDSNPAGPPAFFITHALPEDATTGSRALRRGTERRTRLADAQGPRDTFAFAQDDDGLEPQIPFHDLNRLHGVAEHARQFNLRRGLIGQGPCVRP